MPISRPNVGSEFEAACDEVSHHELEELAGVLRRFRGGERSGRRDAHSQAIAIEDALSTSAMLTAPSK